LAAGRRNTGCRKAREDLAGRTASEFLEVFGNVGERKPRRERPASAGGNTGKIPEAGLGAVIRYQGLREPRAQHRSETILTCVQLVDCALQLFELLPSLAELAFRRQGAVVSKVFGGFRDERVEIRCGLG